MIQRQQEWWQTTSPLQTPWEERPRPTRRELLQKIKELTWEYESGLLVVDTFSNKVAVVPVKNRNLDTIRPALERAFGRLGGKPHSIYGDAEASMTKPEAQTWFRQQGIVHNITMGHAPVSERMVVSHVRHGGRRWTAWLTSATGCASAATRR